MRTPSTVTIKGHATIGQKVVLPFEERSRYLFSNGQVTFPQKVTLPASNGHGAFRFPALPWIEEYSDALKQRVYQGELFKPQTYPPNLTQERPANFYSMHTRKCIQFTRPRASNALVAVHSMHSTVCIQCTRRRASNALNAVH